MNTTTQHPDQIILFATSKNQPLAGEKSIDVSKNLTPNKKEWRMYVGDSAMFGSENYCFLFKLRIKSIK